MIAAMKTFAVKKHIFRNVAKSTFNTPNATSKNVVVVVVVVVVD